MGTPPSNAGGSHVIMAESSPTDVHLTFSGGLGTSGDRLQLEMERGET